VHLRLQGHQKRHSAVANYHVGGEAHIHFDMALTANAGHCYVQTELIDESYTCKLKVLS